jgi:hypothetical protein
MSSGRRGSIYATGCALPGEHRHEGAAPVGYSTAPGSTTLTALGELGRTEQAKQKAGAELALCDFEAHDACDAGILAGLGVQNYSSTHGP